MNKQELAKTLRQRQLAKFEQNWLGLSREQRKNYTRERIISMSDKEIICSYIICSHCGKWILPYSEAVEIAKRCKNFNEWCRKITEISHGV